MQSTIAIFTDLHYGENIKNKYGKSGVNTHGNTESQLQKLNGEFMKASPDFVINMGDLVFGSSVEEKEDRFHKVMKTLESVKDKIIHMIGNHELYVTTAQDIETMTTQKMNTVFECGGYKHITTDMEKGTFWKMPQATFEWLENELKTARFPCIIYGHCPISEEVENLTYYHKDNPEKAFLENSAEIRRLLETYNCKMYISGHTHFEYRTEINGVQHITIPSFSEDENEKPSGMYAILHLDSLKVEMRKV